MKVLVVGATGRTGKLMVELLVEAEHEVFSMVRDQSKMKEMERMGSKPIHADLESNVAFNGCHCFCGWCRYC